MGKLTQVQFEIWAALEEYGILHYKHNAMHHQQHAVRTAKMVPTFLLNYVLRKIKNCPIYADADTHRGKYKCKNV